MAISASPQTWAVGDRIRVRRERWRVAAIDGDVACRVLTLDGLGPSNTAEQRTFLEPFERIDPLGPRRAGGRRGLADLQWRSGRRRWRRACRDVLSSIGPWTRLRSVDAAGIAVMPHQLEPALAVLGGRSTRVLLADAVGLGKTVQAGVLLAELLRRGAARSALVLTPAGLRDQWQQELSARFHLQAEVVDFRTTARAACDLPLGVNPWSTCSLAIASVDYVKRAEVMPAVHAKGWDVVVIDEAHAITPGSDRHAALAPLCRSALFVMLLTATPHSGDRHAFAALRAIGALDAAGDNCLLFRRTGADVSNAAIRRVHVLNVRPSVAESHMHAALDRYADALHLEAGDEARTTLLASTLRKRALSSPESLRVSIDRRLCLLASLTANAGADAPTEEQLPLPFADENDEGGELDGSDAAPRLDGPGLGDVDRELALLERIRRSSIDAVAAETKLAALARLLRRLKKRRESAIVFTEYRDTLLHLHRAVAPDALVLHGGMGRAERRTVIDTFTAGAARVLLATDAAGEGLNLHHACRCVVHLELPWNPVRLEQRIGRVDRIGQSRVVHAFCLVSSHHAERNVLERLVRRVASADEEIGMVSPLESSQVSSDAPARHTHRLDVDTRDAEGREALTRAAEAEADRIQRARALRAYPTRGTRTTSDTRHAAVVSRARPAMRPWLHGQALLIAEIVVADDLGQQLASIVRSMFVPAGFATSGAPAAGGRSASLRDTADRLATSLDGVLANLIACLRDQDPAFTEPTPFWSMVSARAAAIARATSTGAPPPFQPGLFDRLAERLRQLRVDEQAALADLMWQRLRHVEALGRVSVVSLGRVLLLLP